MADTDRLAQIQQSYGLQTGTQPSPSSIAGPSNLGNVEAQQGSDSRLGSMMARWGGGAGSPAGVAMAWYTGRTAPGQLDPTTGEPMGTSSGWDTAFMQTMFQQQDEQQKKGAANNDHREYYNWFDRVDATGVSTWTDAKKGIKAGDVYFRGSKVGNVFEDHDEPTAYLMMAELTLPGDLKTRAFSPESSVELKAEVDDVLAANTTLAQSSESAQAFQSEVEERTEDYLDSGGGFLSTIGGAVGGGALGGSALAIGAAIGLTPVGWVGGALVGGAAALGALGGYLNQDQVVTQVARANVIAEQARDEYGGNASFWSRMQNYGGVATSLITPLQNIHQGAWDAVLGEPGDGASEFYEMDEQGRRRAPGWAKATDVVASLGDGVLQFTSPLGMYSYMGTMGVHAAGRIGEMSATQGAFDFQQGQFHQFEGAAQWASGLGAVGIETALTVGLPLGLMRAASTTGKATSPGALTEAGIRGPQRKPLMPWNRAAEGQEWVSVAGRRFLRDTRTGAPVRTGWVPDAVILAPSEFLKWVPISWKARAAAIRRGPDATITVEDWYNAALQVAGTPQGGNLLSHSFLNGFVEGSEALIQVGLDEGQFGRLAGINDLGEGFFYGMAGGIGMSMGALSRAQGFQAGQRHRADLARAQAQLQPFAEGEWESMTEEERTRWATLSPTAQAEISQGLKDIERSAQALGVHSQVGIVAVADAMRSQYASDISRSIENPEQSVVLVPMTTNYEYNNEGRVLKADHPADSAQASATQIMRLITRHHENLEVQLGVFEQEVERGQQRLAAATTPEAQTEAQEELDVTTSQLAQLTLAVQAANQVFQDLMRLYSAYRDAQFTGTAQAAIRAMNDYIDMAYEGRMVDTAGEVIQDERLQQAAQRAVEIILTRHPNQASSSYGRFRPRVSFLLSESNDHGQVQIHQSLWKGPGADADGDTLQTVNVGWVPAEVMGSLRRGEEYLQQNQDGVRTFDANGKVVLSEGTGVKVVSDAPDSEAGHFKMLSLASRAGTPQDKMFSLRTHAKISQMIHEFFDPHFSAEEIRILDKAIEQLHEDIRAQDVDARTNLLSTLYTMLPNTMRNMADEVGNVLAQFSQRFTTTLISAQKIYAENNLQPGNIAPVVEEALDTSPITETNQAQVEDVQRTRAATSGQDLGIEKGGAPLHRAAGAIYYTARRARVDSLQDGFTSEMHKELSRELLEQLGRDESALSELLGKERVQKQALSWLKQFAEGFLRDQATKGRIVRMPNGAQATWQQAAVMMINTRAPSIDFNEAGQHTISANPGEEITLGQLLLRRSVALERQQHPGAMEQDQAFQDRMSALDRMTRPNPRGKRNSTTHLEVFQELLGEYQMEELLGDATGYLGVSLSLDDWLDVLGDVSAGQRRAMLRRWRSRSDYVLADAIRDDSSTVNNNMLEIDEVTNGFTNPYRTMVDALASIAQTRNTSRKAKDTSTTDLVKRNIDAVQRIVKARIQGEATRYTTRPDGTEWKLHEILEDIASRDTAFAREVAALFPADSALAVFIEGENGRWHAPEWFAEMFEAPDLDRAAAIWRYQTWMAAWRQKGAVVTDENTPESEVELIAEAHSNPWAFDKLDSRFHQFLYDVSKVSGTLEVFALTRDLSQARSIEHLMELINQYAQGTRGELFAFSDDVAEFKEDPSQVWAANLKGPQLIEALKNNALKLENRLAGTQDQIAEERAATERIGRMRTELNRLNDPTSQNLQDTQAREDLRMMDRAFDAARLIPDTLGPAARSNALMLQHDQVEKVMDKAAAADPAEVAGNHIGTAFAMSVQDSVQRALNAYAGYTVAEIIGNPTLLAQGEVKVNLEGGGHTFIDVTTTEGRLAMLEEPALRELAYQIMIPVRRDISPTTGMATKYYTLAPTLNNALNGSKLDRVLSKSGELLPYNDAMHYGSLLETAAMQHELHAGRSPEGESYMGFQRAVSEFMLAYTHGTGGEWSVDSEDHARIVRELAGVWGELGSVLAANTEEAGIDLIGTLKRQVKQELYDRWAKAHEQTSFLALTENESEIIQLVLANFAFTQTQNQLAQMAQDIIEAEREFYRDPTEENSNAVRDANERFEKYDLEHGSGQGDALLRYLQSALDPDFVGYFENLYKMTGNVEDDIQRQVIILDTLDSRGGWASIPGNNALRELVDSLRDKTNSANYQKRIHDPGVITGEEWAQLGNLAATVDIIRRSGLTASSVKQPILDSSEGSGNRRFFDRTYGYLLDNIFNENLLEQAKQLAAMGGRLNTRTLTQLRDQIMHGLLNEQRFGEMTPELTRASEASTNYLLKQLPVGLSIPSFGNNPADWASLSAVTRRLPGRAARDGATAHSDVKPPAVNRVRQDSIPVTENGAEWTLEQQFYMDNAFFRSVVLVVDDNGQERRINLVLPHVPEQGNPTNLIDPSEASQLGQIWAGDATNGTAYKLVGGRQLQTEVARRFADLPTGATATLEVEYLDIRDKFTDEAHNPFFDGLGRSGVTATQPSLLAEMPVGPAGDSISGQVKALKFVKNQGSAIALSGLDNFRDFVRSLPTRVEDLHERLRMGAIRLAAGSYPDAGERQQGDHRSFYKFLETTTVIVGKNAQGNTEAAWAAEMLDWLQEPEAERGDFWLTDYEIVELDMVQARRLLGDAVGRDAAHTSNQNDLAFDKIGGLPSLTTEYLERTNMLDLGKTFEAADSGLAYLPPLQTHFGRSVDTNPRRAKLAQRDKAFQQRMFKIGAKRFEKSYEANNEEYIRLLSNTMTREEIETTLRAYGIGIPADISAQDLTALQMTLSGISQAVGNIPQQVIHLYSAGQEVNFETAAWNQVAVEQMQHNPSPQAYEVGHKDLVIVDLVAELRQLEGTPNQGDVETAFKSVRKAIEFFASRGATIYLQTKDMLRSVAGDSQEMVRGVSELAEQIEATLLGERGSLEYELAGSGGRVFKPLQLGFETNKTQRALDSKLVETRTFTPHDLSGVFVAADGSVDASEQGLFRVHRRHSRKDSQVVMQAVPTSVRMKLRHEQSGFLNQQAALALPVASEREHVRKRALDILAAPEGQALLKKLAGKDPLDPTFHRYTSDTGKVISGFVPLDQAMQRLHDHLEQNAEAISQGRELAPGDLYLLYDSSNDTIMFSRIGMQMPTVSRYADMVQEGFEAAEGPVRVAISTNKLEPNWSTYQGTVSSMDPSGRVKMEFDHGLYGNKSVFEGGGWKSLSAPVPAHLHPAQPDLNDAIGFGIDGLTDTKTVDEKFAIGNRGDNLRVLFTITGINFQRDLVRAFTGRDIQRTDVEWSRAWDAVRTMLSSVMEHKQRITPSEMAMLLDTANGTETIRTILEDVSTMDVAQAVLSETGFDWTDFVTNVGSGDWQSQLAVVIVATLLTPGITSLNQVIGTPGLLNATGFNTADATNRFLPELLTDTLSSRRFPELRKEMLRRVNAALPAAGASGNKPFFVDENFNTHMLVRDEVTGAERYIRGWLHLENMASLSENSMDYSNAMLRRERAATPIHTAATLYQTTGAVSMGTEDQNSWIEKAAQRRAAMRESADTETGRDFFRVFNLIPKDDTTYEAPPRRLNKLEQDYDEYRISERRLIQTRFDRSFEDWQERGADFDQAAGEFLRKLLGFVPEAHGKIAYIEQVEFMIRQRVGIAAPREGQGREVGRVPLDLAMNQLAEMSRKIDEGYLPVHASMIPLMSEPFLRVIYEHNKDRKDAFTFAPRVDPSTTERASTWQDWVHAAFGQYVESEGLTELVFGGAISGMLATYQDTEGLVDSNVLSTDPVLNRKLGDQTLLSERLSMDAAWQASIEDPAIIRSNRQMNLQAIIHGDAQIIGSDAWAAQASPLADRLQRMDQWHTTRNIPRARRVMSKSYVRAGAEYTNDLTRSYKAMSSLVNLSIGIRLFNPQIWMSTLIEVPIRRGLEGATNLIRGESLSRGAMRRAKMVERAGGKPRYSSQTLKRVDAVARKLAQEPAWRAMVINEIVYKQFVEQGQGKVSEAVQKAAEKAAVLTDVYIGSRGVFLARAYIEAAIETISASDDSISLETLLNSLNENPEWLFKQYAQSDAGGRSQKVFNPHQAGLNRVAQIRGAKPTVLSAAVGSGIDSLMHRDGVYWNFAGFLLKLPNLFLRFNSSTLATIMGADGLDQMVAMMLDGRKKGGIMRRIDAAIKGETLSEAQSRYNLSDVIEGLDLTRPFTRGALTLTAYMAIGMAAGSLIGEDDETRRRKRLAKAMGTPYYYDPRRLENDFRNGDKIFLDWLPSPLRHIFETEDATTGEKRAMVAPHWIIKQFLSPVIGIERFLQTGDFRNVKWGFQDAISVIPNSATRLWREARLSADELSDMAAASANANNPDALAQTNRLLISAVGIYEKALFESSFVNNIRTWQDEYDRDPWTLPEIENGQRVFDADGHPVPSQALEPYIDPESGEVRTGYASRKGREAILHQYAENNATASFVFGLVTGQNPFNSSFSRRNMAVKERKVDLTTLEGEAAKGYILAMLEDSDAVQVPGLSQDEAERLVRNQKREAGQGYYGDDEEVQKVALSVVDAAGVEKLTDEGALAVFRGLWAGTVDFEDASMHGISISQETRNKLSVEIIEDLVTEGMEMGMDSVQASYRANRIWRGEPGELGLQDIVYSNKIPSKPYVAYKQLNSTYTMGPDGLPYATGFARDKWFTVLGVPVPYGPIVNTRRGLNVDGRLNTTDAILGLNTGARALDRIIEDPVEPPSELEDLIKTLGNSGGTNRDTGAGGPYGGGYSGRSGGRWRGGGYRRNGGTGSYTSSGGNYYAGGSSAYFNAMRSFERRGVAQGGSLPYIRGSNFNIRRANIRRERITSTRGRLKQWQ